MFREFRRETEFASQDACQIAAALERGRYNSRIQRRAWTKYSWEYRYYSSSGVRKIYIS